MRRVFSGPLPAAAGLFIAMLMLVALAADWLAPWPFDFREPSLLLAAPSPEHLLGTDAQGRDVLSLLLHGARAALLVGLCTTALSMLIGVPLGLLSGYVGGKTDGVIMGIVEVVFAFPGILLAILLVFITQTPSLANVVLALGATAWAGWARLVRGQVVQEKVKDYVLLARTAGAGTARILRVHLLPNVASVILVQLSFSIGTAILAESSLSFLGLGPQDVPSWGSMLSEGAALFVCSPFLAAFSGLAIFLSVLSFNALGDRLRDLHAQPDLLLRS